MPQRITDKQKENAWRMYQEGESINRIAKSVRVSYASAWGMTEGRRQGFASRSEYQEHLAQQKGFASLTEYHEHLAQQKGFASRSEYQEHLAKERGFASLTKYQEHLAKERGFASLTEYREHLAKERSRERPNKELSNLIKSRLKKLKRNQSWLAEQIGVSRQAVSFYATGKTIPQDGTLNRLFAILKVKRIPKSLDDLFE